MKHWKCVVTNASLLLAGSVALAQSTDQGQTVATPAQTAPAPFSLSLGPVDFSALADVYYGLNFNHPASQANQLRAFDVNASQLRLNMTKLTMEHSPDPVGFRVDAGYGRAFDIMHGSERGPGVFRYLPQAYVSLKPKSARGLQVDFGKFSTAAGAEVIETNSNWNYSRSLLFAYAVPYYHFGLRATMPAGRHFTGGLQVINGWNCVEDNNSGKTVAMVATVATSKLTWTQAYLTGPEKTDTNKGNRHLYDTTLVLTPGSKVNVYLNFDYGVDKKVDRGSMRWVGVAGAARFAVTPWLAVSPRLEWFNDADGFTTGTVQKVKEGTLTAEFKIRKWLLTRLEYRRDWSNALFFNRGADLAASRGQTTLLAGLVAVLEPKR